MSALVERIIAARDRLKQLDRRDMGYGDDVKLARDAMADAANAINERDETIFYLRRRLEGEAISEPDHPGAFIGDIWFGHPIKRNLGTHRWDGEWKELSSEEESVLNLLAEARRRNEVLGEMLRQKSEDGSARQAALNECWRTVDACGGEGDSSNDYDRGYICAISEACTELEKLGAKPS